MNKALDKLYYLSIFFILLPSISGGPFFSTIHSIGGYISAFLITAVIYKLYRNNASLKIDNKILILFLTFFASQSMSVFSAENISSFISTYKEIVFSGFFFILSIYFINDSKSIKNVILVLFAVAAINIFFQIFILLFPNYFVSFGQTFINPSYLSSVSFNLVRGRVSIAAYDEIMIPIILYYWIRSKNRKILLPLGILISIFSFLSEFRTKIIMLGFALAGSILIFKNNIKKYFIFLLIVPIVFYLLYSIQGYTVLDRFLLQNQTDISTVTSRIQRWEMAFEMGLSSPLIGVGLGNYYDYLPLQYQKSYSGYSFIREEYNAAATDTHDIFFQTFAETGILGLGTFVALLLYFVKKDFRLLRHNNAELSKALVISFWTLFIYSLFNPSLTTITYPSLFWLLRVIIEKSVSLYL